MHSVLRVKTGALVSHGLTRCCFVNCIGVQAVVDAMGKLGGIFGKKQPTKVYIYIYTSMLDVRAHVTLSLPYCSCLFVPRFQWLTLLRCGKSHA